MIIELKYGNTNTYLIKAKGAKLEYAAPLAEEQLEQWAKYVVKNIPVAGGMAKDMEIAGQMTL